MSGAELSGPSLPVPRWLRFGVGIALLLELAIGLGLRFGVSQPLWLDEALSVNIAKLPMSQLPGALRQDGAPPLYYVLLHLWISVFGSSASAVRSLSGLCSVATIAVAAVVFRRLWGNRVALLATALLVAAPFAIYYATEARMYALVMLEVTLLLGLVDLSLRRPRPLVLLGLVVVVAALLYTHYWSIYLLAAVGLWLGFRIWRSPRSERRAPVRTLLALAGGGVCFLPWLPTFLYQAAHTGTPWGEPPPLSIPVDLIGWFTWNQAAIYQVPSLHAKVLIAGYLGAMVLGLVAVATGSLTVAGTWLVQPRARLMGWLCFGTIGFGSAAALLAGSVVTARYAAVAFIPLIVLLALGLDSFGAPLLKVAVAVVLAGTSLWAAWDNRATARTESVLVAKVLTHHASAGDVVVFCPDQLGPSTLRLLPPGRFRTIGFPRFGPVVRINWVDYEVAVHRADPTKFALATMALAGPTHHVWLAWSPHAWGLHGKCGQLEGALAAQSSAVVTWLPVLDHRFFQPMALTEFSPLVVHPVPSPAPGPAGALG